MPESRKRAVLASAALDFPSISAGATEELTIDLDDARAGDAVALGPPANLQTGLIPTGYVNASDQVVVRVLNSTGSAVDPAVSTKEVQDLVSDHTGGTFTLSFNGEAASSALAYNDDGTGITAYLEALEVTSTPVEVTTVENATGDWTITFDVPIEDLPALVVDDTSLTGGQKEVQDLDHDHTGGTFTISWNGEAESSALAFDDDGSGITAYLEAFTYTGGIHTDVAVTVTTVENATGDWTITFDTPIADLPPIVVEDDSLTGGTTIDLVATTAGVGAVLTETAKGVSAEDALWSVALII